MRYITIFLLALSMNGLEAGQSVSTPEQPPKKEQQPKMSDQVDQTDIFAIQLDSSEAEQNEEYNDLMKESEELQKNK